jgi:hypothetical protein
MKIVRLALAGAAALAAILSFGCDENPENRILDNLYVRIHSGNYQRERPGAALADPLVIRVRDFLDNSKSGVPVTFSTSIPGAVVTPAIAVTDAAGLASCSFTLGPGEGAQYVRAAIADDTVAFTIYADAIACPEENPQRLCLWPAAHLFIATTGSSLRSSPGSVIIDYDPAARSIAKVLETEDMLEGISFSSRGELFVSSLHSIRKVNHAAPALDAYITYAESVPLALDPNPGGVLAGLWEYGAVMINCAPGEISLIVPPHTFSTIEWRNVAVDPVTRDCHIITKNSPIAYTLWRLSWDGRSLAETQTALAAIQVGASSPTGMCVDSAGATYIVFDGNDSYRRIVRVSADGTIDYDFFDFYARAGGNAQEAGRWGDIAYLNGRLYLIDRRNDRLVTISRNGVWLDEHKDTAFSRALDESDHYMIAPSPSWLCITASDKDKSR